MVADESLDDFSSKVITLLCDEDLRRRKGWEAIEYAHTWSAEDATLRLIELYEALLWHRQQVSLDMQQAGETA
jgi:hypothetical protein